MWVCPKSLQISSRGLSLIHIWVQEDVAVVECCDQAGCLGAEQTVTEHVTGHVTDADCGELFGLSVVAELSEVTLDGLPSTACGDAHCLVVVDVYTRQP